MPQPEPQKVEPPIEAPAPPSIPDTPEPTAPPIETPLMKLWRECLDFMARRGDNIDWEIGGGNIMFVSGYGPDGQKNDNKPNLWNDLCFVVRMTAEGWRIAFAAKCTTAPGNSPSLSKDALKKGGVARVVPGQYFAWRIGFHKISKYGMSHPAFVQADKIWISRDFNQDLASKGDKVYFGMYGINIHAVGDGKTATLVNFNSEGCLVLENFDEKEELLAIAKDFNSYKKSGKDTIFAATIIEGTELQ